MDSKDAILFDILETYLRELRDLICGLEMEGLSPPEKLHRVVAEILLAYQGVDDEHRVQTSGMSALPEDQQRLLRGYQRDMVNFLSAILSEVAPDVFQGDGAKLRSATMSVFGMLNWFYMWNGRSGTEAREDYADLVTGMVLGGLRALHRRIGRSQGGAVGQNEGHGIGV